MNASNKSTDFCIIFKCLVVVVRETVWQSYENKLNFNVL